MIEKKKRERKINDIDFDFVLKKFLEKDSSFVETQKEEV